MSARRCTCICIFLIPLIAVVLLSCATAGERAPFAAAGRGDRLLADSIHMTGNEDIWGRGMAPAQFGEGALFEGVECIEVMIPFGETAVAWNFSGLPAGAPVAVVFDVNLDFFDKETYLYAACMPGSYSAEQMEEPREDFRSFQEHGWADGSARWPDSTGGWQSVSFAGREADENGELTVVMIFGHPKEDPPIVFAHITNPALSPAE